MKTNIYLYLAKRDKKGIKIVAILQGNPVNFNKVTDIKKLGLPKQMEEKLDQVKYNERMDWELCIESAPTFSDLLNILKNRGYKNFPTSQSPVFYEVDFYGVNIETNKIDIKSSMLRRKD